VLESMKLLIGRSRPNEDVGAFSFHPFTSLKDSAGVSARGAMPSGHALAAFAVVTSLADDIHSTPVHVLLYTAAGGTAFSRVYENRHWASDVAMGTVLSITIGKVVSGRWRIFNLRPPSFLVGPSGETAVRWSVTF
jgi:membrane-associated phospholipid phosphatase